MIALVLLAGALAAGLALNRRGGKLAYFTALGYSGILVILGVALAGIMAWSAFTHETLELPFLVIAPVALFLGGATARHVYIRAGTPTELGPTGPRAIEASATRERWYKQLVFRTTWRLAASAIPAALLIAGLALYGAVGESQKDLARYLKWTAERQKSCAEALAKARADAMTNFDLRILEAACTPPSQPKGVLHYLATNLNDAFLAWIGLSASLFAILTAVSLYFSERETGWRRLGIVGLVSLIFQSTLSVVNLAAAFLLAAASFPAGILLVLGGRSMVKWVRAGFTDAAHLHSKRFPD